jgi:hypothetical protein
MANPLKASAATNTSGIHPSCSVRRTRITFPTTFPVPGVEDAVMRLNPASTNLVEIRSKRT